MANLRLRVHALQGHQNHRRNVDSYARQRESHSRCERVVSTKFLPIATCKAKWSKWSPRNSCSENYKNGYNGKESEIKTHLKFQTILQERTALRSCKGFDPRSFDKHSLCATHIHSAFGDGKLRAILVDVRREPCGEAYLLRFCREQSHNSAGAWSNW